MCTSSRRASRRALCLLQTLLPSGTEQRRRRDVAGTATVYPYFSNGAYVARVSVDTRTGLVKLQSLTAVHDCGRIINRVLLEGQLHGAMAMGVGLALYERSSFDESGALLTGSLKHYLVPRANDLPSFSIGHHETLSPVTLLGAKGGGEAGVSGALAAVANAVDDAVSRRGATVTRFPLSPPEVVSILSSTDIT